MYTKLFFAVFVLQYCCSATVIATTKKEDFVKILFLDDLQTHFETNANKTASCYTNIESNYKTDIMSFTRSMKYSSESVKTVFPDFMVTFQQKASAALKELWKLGEKMQEYQKFLRQGIDGGKVDRSAYYTSLVKTDIRNFYDNFLTCMKFFDGRKNREEGKLKKHISERRDPFLETLKKIAIELKTCMAKTNTDN